MKYFAKCAAFHSLYTESPKREKRGLISDGSETPIPPVKIQSDIGFLLLRKLLSNSMN